ncbi:MAG: transposase [Candidatus Kapabacteria bacterium]|nr:transposase [Candidatus Kapabacteria bacterium]
MFVRCCTMQTALHQMTPNELIKLIEQRDQRIAERDQRLAERDQCLAERDQRLAERDQRLAERDQQLEHKQARIFDLEFLVKELQRLAFGAKRERFISEVPEAQLTLGLDTTDAETAEAVKAEIESITYERKELRLQKSLPLLNTISAWLVAEIKNTVPRSPIGKAMHYCVRLWDELMAYLHNGHLEIDNNLMENAIRPVALGPQALTLFRLACCCRAHRHVPLVHCHVPCQKRQPLRLAPHVPATHQLHSTSSLPHPAAAQDRPQRRSLTRNM